MYKVQLCRDGVRKAKTKLELNLSRDAKNNRRSSTDILGKKQRLVKEYPLINNSAQLVTMDEEKTEVINIFSSVLNDNLITSG